MTTSLDPRAPSTYPRRILVASLGLAPQVLTETLYCLGKPDLLQPKRPALPFVPTEIHVVTTEEGRERASLTLLHESTARLPALESDYGLTGIAAALKPENIHVIKDLNGDSLPDIDSERDNAATADLMVSLLRLLSADPESALHVSIAGGRKTMGFLLGYALSLFGRPQDRLSHVLVSKPFESHPKFFYPPPKPIVLHDQANRPHNTAAAQLILAEIPIVRLRDGLPRGLLMRDRSYSETVAAAQGAIAIPEMIVDFQNKSLVCGGKTVKLSPATFAFAAWLAQRAVRLGPEQGAMHWSKCNWDEFIGIYAALPGQRGEHVEKARARVGSDAEEFFREQVARLRRALWNALESGSAPYEPRRFGNKPMTRVGFALSSDTINVLDAGKLGSGWAKGDKRQAGRRLGPLLAARGNSKIT